MEAFEALTQLRIAGQASVGRGIDSYRLIERKNVQPD
jgi:hypothetical protein